MPIQRRKFLQSATVLPLAATLPGIAQAAEPGLYLAQYRKIIAEQMTIVGQGQVTGGFSYLNTVNARGVFIDIVPEPGHHKNALIGEGPHSGICFHAAPKFLSNGSTEWQQAIGPFGNQNFWYQGVGVVFYRDLVNGIGSIWSERWIVDEAGGPNLDNHYPIGQFPLNTILRVTATTNYTTRQTDIAVYSVNQQGNVTGLLGSTTLTADVIGDYAAVFAIDAGAVQVTPNALYY